MIQFRTGEFKEPTDRIQILNRKPLDIETIRKMYGTNSIDTEPDRNHYLSWL